MERRTVARHPSCVLDFRPLRGWCFGCAHGRLGFLIDGFRLSHHNAFGWVWLHFRFPCDNGNLLYLGQLDGRRFRNDGLKGRNLGGRHKASPDGFVISYLFGEQNEGLGQPRPFQGVIGQQHHANARPLMGLSQIAQGMFAVLPPQIRLELVGKLG